MVYTDLFKQHRFNEYEQWLRDNLLMEVVMGSQAYGTNTEDSDYDVVGLVMPKHEHLYPQAYGYVLGFDQLPAFKSKECKGEKLRLVLPNGKDVEGEWNALTNFFYLAGVKGSPSLVETLFVRRNLVTFATPVTWLLRDNRRLFLSMKTYHALKGYAFQQLSRMKRGVARWMETGECENSNRKYFFEQFGYDVKMAYHPLRLLDLCHQLLTENDLDLMRNKEECKTMRRGEWGSFEKFEDHVNKKLSNLEDLALKSPLTNKPQTQPLHNLLMSCVEEWYGSESKLQRQSTEYVSASDVMNELRELKELMKGDK
ncbi:MAG: DNA polymerase beta superfamily protein [bacterium]